MSTSIARHHAEWLSLLEISGPFLSMPVLMSAFPQGLDAVDPDRVQELRSAYDEWVDNQDGLRPDPAIHTVWIQYVLNTVLGLPAEVLAEGQAIPDGIKAVFPEHATVLRPDLMIVDPDTRKPRLLIQKYPKAQDLEKPPSDGTWQASAARRMMELLHSTEIRLGLVTNGEQWMLIDAPRGETTGYCSWYASLWIEERITLQAFRSLLGVSRFFNVPADQTLDSLLAASAKDQHDVTDQLGYQVRHAVEILIQSLDKADQDRGRTLLASLDTETLYEAALTVMMRLVFMLYAEERGLLLLGDPVYNQNYAVSTLREQLRELADRHGEEVLERRFDAWSRLLATFRVVYSGVEHDRMKLPAYGGNLFDPDRFPFLEGRPENTNWRTTIAQPLPVNNRIVLHLLEALQVLRVKVPGGGGAEARRLSFKGLDIEQIGHVYEGLLDHQALRADEPVLGLAGSKDSEAEIPLAELEQQAARGQDSFVDFLHEATGRSTKALQKALTVELEPADAGMLRTACGNDEDLLARVEPFAGLIRTDDFGWPVVIPADSFYVTLGTTRRASGTHYTPRSLTEPIVQHTLEPLVYVGPAEGHPREKWQLRSARELLDLKICDMAMGSGAFLVQVCRYLAERLVEAWEALAPAKPGSPQITPEGQRSTGAGDEMLIPSDNEARLTLARRLIADRCLYGVDKNHLAVEMAKLSLWLITMDKGRPFSFLDHALKCGDSLVGVTLEQLRHWNLDTATTSGALYADTIRTDIDRIIALRREIEQLPVRTPDDLVHKRILLLKAEATTHDLRRGGNMLILSYYNDLGADDQETFRDVLLHAFRDGSDVPDDWKVATLGTLRPFHWQLEFPEVFFREGKAGFDAFVGNPPFQGGMKISTMLGSNYLRYLRLAYPHSTGTADLCAFFFLRAFNHLRLNGTSGLIATNTIAQGDTRETGLDYIVQQGCTIYRATNNQAWSGIAAVSVNVVHFFKGFYDGSKVLDGRSVDRITPLLDDAENSVKPFPLTQSQGRSFIGSYVLGMGFVLEPFEVTILLSKNELNAQILFPFLSGDDLNSSSDQSATRWVINFHNWTLEEAEQYPECIQIVRNRVKPERDKLLEGNATAKDRGRRWWQFARPTINLYATISVLSRVLVTTMHSKYLCFTFVNPKSVFSHALAVCAFEDSGSFALLQSNFHEAWARNYASSLETRLRYTPSDCFETFPFPQNYRGLEISGEAYHEHRRQIMLSRQEGLTATYNRFHDPDESAADITHLRDLHVEMDCVVAAAYGWSDLALDHGFHETAQGTRFTIGEAARREVLSRLLKLNHERYAEEVRQGLHEKGAKKGKKSGKAAGRMAESAPSAQGESGAGDAPLDQLGMFDDEPKQKRLF